MDCSKCKYANKSGSKDFVFCTFWQDECNKSGLSEEDFVRKEIFSRTALSQVALGWGFPPAALRVRISLGSQRYCVRRSNVE